MKIKRKFVVNFFVGVFKIFYGLGVELGRFFRFGFYINCEERKLSFRFFGLFRFVFLVFEVIREIFF